MENQAKKHGSAIKFTVDTVFSEYEKKETCRMALSYSMK